ncbi:MAG TPA: phosphoribosylamine--glycine ligase [Gammaproteobacteria bacterium]|nr:phosphoribosylamine--glycine ligase [Gammaproteobacteria bacterium]
MSAAALRVLIVGGGGREHALAWRTAQSPRVASVLVAPGNAGTALEPKVANVPIKADDIGALSDLASREKIDLTIVGPEQPLVAGIADRFAHAGLRCFGPIAAAARLEGSKAYTKAFLERHGIPTARSATFDALEPALAHVRARELPVVVKADGLAAGKGVIIAHSAVEAEAAVRSMLADRAFGAAGARIVVEDFLVGEEASFIVMVDGTNILPLASSQDHKTRDDGDRGPNTGGMGAYSPAPVVTPAMHERIMRTVMRPTVEGLRADGIAYRGFLYAGLMIDPTGLPRVLEFNCRFGDPETQPILMRLRSDLVDLCLRSFDGGLAAAPVEWDSRAAVGVVMASRGYPGNYLKNAPIDGLDEDYGPDVKIFHAGTRLADGRVLTDGGRVLCAVALGETVTAAQRRVYEVTRKIRWEGAFYRSDIGYRAVARESGRS